MGVALAPFGDLRDDLADNLRSDLGEDVLALVGFALIVDLAGDVEDGLREDLGDDLVDDFGEDDFGRCHEAMECTAFLSLVS